MFLGHGHLRTFHWNFKPNWESNHMNVYSWDILLARRATAFEMWQPGPSLLQQLSFLMKTLLTNLYMTLPPILSLLTLVNPSQSSKEHFHLQTLQSPLIAPLVLSGSQLLGKHKQLAWLRQKFICKTSEKLHISRKNVPSIQMSTKSLPPLLISKTTLYVLQHASHLKLRTSFFQLPHYLLDKKLALISIWSSEYRSPSSPEYDLSKPPYNYNEALCRLNHAIWQATIDKELNMFIIMKIFREELLPPGRFAIGSTWVFEYKIVDPPPNIAKGRLCARGYSKIPNIDFTETFAPVVKTTSVWIVTILATKFDLHLECFNTTHTFLWSDLNEIIYMKYLLKLRMARLGIEPRTLQTYTRCSNH